MSISGLALDIDVLILEWKIDCTQRFIAWQSKEVEMARYDPEEFRV
jgi:hypothetical protein